MFVMSRIMKFEKGHLEAVLENMKKKALLESFKGFVRREILVDQKHEEYDLIRMMIYWENKKAFYAWEGSPEHINLHKQGKDRPKPAGLIEVSKEQYEVVYSVVYREEN